MSLDFSKEAKDLRDVDFVIGVDEAGRGPIAGPVVAGAFCFFKLCNDLRAQPNTQVLPLISDWPWSAVADSKTLTEETREKIYDAFVDRVTDTTLKEDPDEPEDPADAEAERVLRKALCDSEALPEHYTRESESARPWVVYADSAKAKRKKTRIEDDKVALDKPVVETATASESGMSTAATSLEELEPMTETLFRPDSEILFAHAAAEPEEIDLVNILEATLRSMTRATYKLISLICQRHKHEDVVGLKFKILVDGNRKPHLLEPGMMLTRQIPSMLAGHLTCDAWTDDILLRMRYCNNETIVKGDTKVLSIAAASIVAKVLRDRMMRRLHRSYPAYDLNIHKGYPTPAHLLAVRNVGPSRIHRLSFAPLYESLCLDRSKVPEERNFESIVTAKTAKKKRPAGTTKKGATKKSKCS